MTSNAGQQEQFFDWCTACGQKCCRTPGTYLSEGEVARLASTLGTRSFVRRIEDRGERFHILCQKNERCVFLRQDGRCAVQNQKPLICRIYPLKVFWDGVKRRWYVTLFCPAAKVFAERFLSDTFERAKGELDHWHDDAIQPLVSLGLLVEVGGHVTEDRLEEAVTRCAQGPRRNQEIHGDTGVYEQPDLGLHIDLEAGDMLWLETEHRSFLEAQWRQSALPFPIKVMATELAGTFGSEEFVNEFLAWGSAFLPGFSLLSRKRHPVEDGDGWLLEYAYQNGFPVRGMRRLTVRERTLFLLLYEEVGINEESDIRRDFHDAVDRIRFTV